MNPIPPDFLELLEDETRAYLFLATIMPDGTPQVTPVWFDAEDGLIRINTNEGRVKDRNMQARPAVAMVIQDPRNPYRYLQIRGEVIRRTPEGADDHINRLSMKYDGKPWPRREGQRRVTYWIRPVHIDAH